MNLDDLWGGVLRDLTVEVEAWRLTLGVEIRLDGVASEHRVVLRDLSGFRLFNAIPLPWTYAELTEIRASRDPSGRWIVRAVLWSEDAGFEARCADVTCDGVLVGTNVCGATFCSPVRADPQTCGLRAEPETSCGTVEAPEAQLQVRDD
jgi:hypothetical protein